MPRRRDGGPLHAKSIVDEAAKVEPRHGGRAPAKLITKGMPNGGERSSPEHAKAVRGNLRHLARTGFAKKAGRALWEITEAGTAALATGEGT